MAIAPNSHNIQFGVSIDTNFSELGKKILAMFEDNVADTFSFRGQVSEHVENKVEDLTQQWVSYIAL